MGIAAVNYLLESKLFISFQNTCRKLADRLAFEKKKTKHVSLTKERTFLTLFKNLSTACLTFLLF